MVTIEQVKDALRTVYDPEIPINVQDLGLIYDIKVEGDHVKIVHTLTSPMCPFADQICNDISEAPLSVPGVNSVESDNTFDPPFTIDMVPEETRLQIGFY